MNKYKTTSSYYLVLLLVSMLTFTSFTTFNSSKKAEIKTYLLVPDRVFDGVTIHQGWAVLTHNNIIVEVGEVTKVKKHPKVAKAKTINLNGTTLMPGLIEGHSHLFLYPYNQTNWNDQVLKESSALRVARAIVHAKANLMAGFTTLRDLGTEGSGYDDVGVKQAIEQGIIPGPRLIIATRAIVATGSYGPKGFAIHVKVPIGAEEADGVDDITKVVRRQIGKGADLIKVYADYRWGPNKEARPTFTIEELKLMVKLTKSSGRGVVAHAATAEGMRRATLAGVETIEHGDGGTPEVFRLMKEKGVALCPTLAAGDAIMQYRGWKKEKEPDPARIVQKKKSFKQALDAGVTIIFGGDVGVFDHGDNVRELEMMVEYGMKPIDVLQSATSINAKVFHMDKQIGKLQKGLLADMIAVQGNPIQNISNMRKVKLVMKDGVIYKQ